MQEAVAAQREKSWPIEAKEAARLVWDNDSDVENFGDLREPAFASAVVTELSVLLHNTSRVVRRVMERAASAAEDLNVEAGYKVTSIHPDGEIFGVPFL